MIKGHRASLSLGTSSTSRLRSRLRHSSASPFTTGAFGAYFFCSLGFESLVIRLSSLSPAGCINATGCAFGPNIPFNVASWSVQSTLRISQPSWSHATVGRRQKRRAMRSRFLCTTLFSARSLSSWSGYWSRTVKLTSQFGRFFL